jgi:hypothetical protein
VRLAASICSTSLLCSGVHIDGQPPLPVPTVFPVLLDELLDEP